MAEDTTNTEGGEGTDLTGHEGDGPYVPAEKVGFPSPVYASFSKIKRPKYRILDPMKFAQTYGKFNREEILKNYELAKSLALRQLDTELEGLNKYAPAAAALKRTEISADNIFNQQQRSAQIAKVMPGVADQLKAQADRAEAFASGRMPSSVEDRALELGIRSSAADFATAGGFGATSSVARKASDLMSAEQRIKLSQYGDSLLTQNIGTTANLMLAPTEYSAAGSEIKVTPEVGAGRLSAGALSEINAATMISTPAALQSTIQQRQFNTNLKMQTRQFNAQGEWAESQFNANTANNFALRKFAYEADFAGMLAGVSSANNATALGIEQQQQAAQIYQDTFGQAQNVGTAGSISSGIGQIMNAIPSIMNGINEVFGGGDSGGSSGLGPTNPDGSANVLGSGYDAGDIEFDNDGPPTINGVPISTPEGGVSGGYAPDTGGTPSAPSGDILNEPIEFKPDYTTTTDYSGGESYSTEAPLTFKTAHAQNGYMFQQATGLTYNPSYQDSTNSTLAMAGVTKDPAKMPSAVEVGSDFVGRKVYANPTLLNATDTGAGARIASVLSTVMRPFDAFNETDLQAIDNVGKTASDLNTLNELTDYAGRGDVKPFVNTLLDKFGKGSVETIAGDKNAVKATQAMFEGMQNFNQLSPEQKSLLVAGFGLKAANFQGKKSLGEVVIPSTVKPGVKPVVASDTLRWMSQGINAYPLTKKWDQFSSLAKVLTGKNDKDTVAQVAKQYNLLGAGVNGAEVQGVTAASLKKTGWTPTPQLGVGAIKAKSGTTIPQGYTQVADDGKNMLAAPKGTAYSAFSSVNKTATPLSRQGQQSIIPQSVSNVLDWGTNAFNIYNMWQKRPGVSSFLGTGQIIANNIDARNLQRAIEKQDPTAASNYGQYIGSAVSLYNGYLAAKGGDVAGAAGNFSQGSFLAAQAYYNSIGNEAAAATMGQYAGYANAGINIAAAIKAFQAGDTAGGVVSLTSAGSSLLSGGPGPGMAISGAYAAYKGWGSGNVGNGVVGGSMMMAGMSMMGMPYVGAAMMAVSIIGNAVKTGRTNKEHIARVGIREALQNNSLIDENYMLTLPDGTQYNMGWDDWDGEHQARNPEKLVGAGKQNEGGRLHSYDIDYTNDLDYVSSMGGTTLLKLLSGETSTGISQVGGQLANGMLANIGTGQDMTRENFDKLMTNMRATYSKAGIASKNDMYQLANAAFAEGRIGESELMVMHQTANMMFDEGGYELSQQLMGGRWSGIEEAGAIAEADKRTDVPADTSASEAAAAALGGILGKTPGEEAAGTTYPEFQPYPQPGDPTYTPTGDYNEVMPGLPGYRGNRPVSGSWPNATASAITGETRTPGMPEVDMSDSVFQNYLKNRTTRMTKEEIRRMNETRYAEAV